MILEPYQPRAVSSLAELTQFVLRSMLLSFLIGLCKLILCLLVYIGPNCLSSKMPWYKLKREIGGTK